MKEQHEDLDQIVTPIKVQVLQQLLEESKYDEIKTKELVDGFTWGFDMGYRGPVSRTDVSNNIPISVGSVEIIWKKVMKEVKCGRYAGPFEEIPYKSYM